MLCLTLELCDAVDGKSKRIVLHTIGVMDENRPLLEGCTSSPAKHHFVPDPTMISDLFDLIANDLITVRLVQ